MFLPRLVVLDQLDGISSHRQPVRRERLPPQRGPRVDTVPVVLEVEIELPVRVPERARVDASANVRLADDGLRALVDEWTHRIGGGRDPDALRTPPDVTCRIIKEVGAADLDHFGCPGEARLRPASEPRESIPFR